MKPFYRLIFAGLPLFMAACASSPSALPSSHPANPQAAKSTVAALPRMLMAGAQPVVLPADSGSDHSEHTGHDEHKHQQPAKKEEKK